MLEVGLLWILCAQADSQGTTEHSSCRCLRLSRAFLALFFLQDVFDVWVEIATSDGLENWDHSLENSLQDLSRSPHRIDLVNDIVRVIVEHGRCLLPVNLEAATNNVRVCVVRASVNHRTVFDSLDNWLFFVSAAKVDDTLHINDAAQFLTLNDISWDPIKQHDFGIRRESRTLDLCIQPCFPDLDSQFIGNQLATADDLVDFLALFRIRVESAEDIAG